MSLTPSQIRQLKFLYRQLHATTDGEEQLRIQNKITEIKKGLKKPTPNPDDKLSWKRELSKLDDQKKREGIDAHKFVLERLKNKIPK